MALKELRYVGDPPPGRGPYLNVDETFAEPRRGYIGTIYLGFDTLAEAIAWAQSLKLQPGGSVRVEVPSGLRPYERHAPAVEP